ncbi:hypothetical protein [Pseudaminobacter sp. NGMCC 1.201702]|uniref:hypothetical protein n=1 Tax=Pseudaminobacter sp. NGMCC 1.201702 TaxID=3391825 RepID=UPI0039F03384
MRKSWIAAIAAACVLAFTPLQPAVAQQQCVPIAALVVEITNANIPADKVFVTRDVGIINAYVGKLGIGIPDGSQPIGLVTVELSDRVFIALVEPGDCIRHTGLMSIQRHRIALNAAIAGV